jgi:hypothetical protein
MSKHKSLTDRPRRIELADDVLIIDEDFCQEVLGAASRRTAKRFEAQGLPHIMIAGAKYRPLRAGRIWLADRIRKNQTQKRRRA